MFDIFLSPPLMSGKEQVYIQNAFKTNWIASGGENVEQFEKELSTYVGAKGSVALSSGTAGIHLALKSVGVERGDLVFCSTFTFAGSCNPIVYEGAEPVFIESEKESWNMSPQALEEAFEWARRHNKKPKAVIIVDLYGQSANYDALKRICKAYDTPIIEDAAEALGATYKGKACGTLGEVGILSFNGNKMITTSGGGMLLSDHSEILKKVRFWANQAKEPKMYYEHKEVGYNYRLSNISAGIGRGQLVALEQFLKRRKAIYETYQKAFEGLPLKMMPIASYGIPNYWLSVLTLDEEVETVPEVIIKKLGKEKIESRMIWNPMHLQPIFKQAHYFQGEGPVSESIFKRGICLPSGASLTPQEQNKVIECMKRELLR